MSQDEGGKSLRYHRTQINSPNLTVDASQVNVRVGVPGTIVPGGSGLPTQFVPTQTLQQGLSQMINSGQPGMSWVTQLQTDHSLDDKINWQGVPVGQRAWAEGQGSLTQTGAAVVTIVATVLTLGVWGGVRRLCSGFDRSRRRCGGRQCRREQHAGTDRARRGRQHV